MAQPSKLEELLAAGIGCKSSHPSPKTLTTKQLKPALGTVSPVTDNLFLAINGRMTNAHRAGLIDVMVIECLGFGRAVTDTPSGRFAVQEYKAVSETYAAIQSYASKVCGKNRSIAGTLAGTSILRPAFDDDKVPALLSYSFFSYGSRGGLDTVNVAGKSFPRTQLNPRLIRSSIHGICAQLQDGTFTAGFPTDRKIRIGLPRILGGIGGVFFADLLDVLTAITAEYPTFEFYVFSNTKPDDAVVVGVDVPKTRRKPRASNKKNASKDQAKR